MRVVTLDIETTPSEPYDEVEMIRQPADSESSEWVIKKKFPPLPLHVPEVICWLKVETVDGVPVFEMEIFDRAEENEISALTRLGKDLKAADRLVTWNGRGFDMPLLNLRAMRYGVDWSFWKSRRHRFPNYKKPLYHYDLQDQLGDYGAARSISLNRASKLIGLPGKVGISGGDVEDSIKRGDRDSVIAYCCNDVFETYMVYLAYVNSHLGGNRVQAFVDASMAWAKQYEYLKRFYGV